MSLNVGGSKSRFVAVSNVIMRFDVSERMLFADLRTSRKTGRPKTDEHGEVVLDENGKPVPERVYTHWEGRFVGNAFEAAKGLGKGQFIDIVNGWADKETWIGEDGKKREKTFIVVTDFVLSGSAVEEDGEDDAANEPDAKESATNSAAFRALNGDDNVPAGGGRE